VLGDNVKERNSDKPEYDPTLTKATFGTSAHWSTLAAANKLNNKPQHVDPFKKRQQQLTSSSVFNVPQEYSCHAPTSKHQTFDVNNPNDHLKKCDHLFSDILP